MVDVILTSYNRTDLLDQAIRSVLNQTYQDFILHVIDDGSSWLTRGIIVNHQLSNPKVKYYQTHKKDYDRRKACDYAQNINYVINNSDSEFIAYLTCDDIYYPEHLEASVKYLNEHPEASVVFTDQKVVYYDDNTKVFTPSFDRICPSVVERAACIVDHNQVVMRRSALEESGLWNEDVSVYGAGDAAFWNKLNDAGFKFHRVPIFGSEHRLHKNSVQSLG